MVLIYVHTFFNMPPSRRCHLFPQILRVHWTLTSDEYNTETGKMTVQKAGRHHVTKWSPVMSWLVHGDITNLWYDTMRRVLFCVVFFKKPATSVYSWGNIRQTQTEGPSTKYLVSALQKCQVHETQGKTHPRLEETKEIWWLNAVWNPTEYRSRKSISEESGGTQTQSVILIIMLQKSWLLRLW